MTMHYIPLYTGDYLRDTRHLSPMEHGIYLLLLMYCWDKHGLAPLDERQLFGICNARSNDEMEATKRVLKEFFIQTAEGWCNPRLKRELDHASCAYKNKVEAARKARRHKAPVVSKVDNNPDNNPDNRVDSNVVQSLTRSRSRSISKPDPNAAAASKKTVHRDRKTKFPKDWELPDEWRDWALSNRPDLSYGEIVNTANIYKYDRLSKGYMSDDWFSDFKAWMFRQLATHDPTVTKANGQGGKYDPTQQIISDMESHYL